MNHHRTAVWVGAACMCAALFCAPWLHAASVESQRLERAKDLIGDEQWARAIEELKAASADPREPNKDEALFWLAHSHSQTRDAAAAIATIQRLEREYPRSRWVKPAQSLRIELAQRLRRNDVLWYTAAPPAPPAAPAAPPPPAAASPASVPAPPALAAPAAATPRADGVYMYRIAPPRPPSAPGAAPPVPSTPPPPAVWVPEGYLPDTDLRIQALGSLMHTDAVKVIPMLKAIALEGGNPNEARRALFVLAQSGRPDARATVVDVAKTGPESVRVAAVRELGRIGGATILNDLLQVYSTGDDRVKYQVVTSLGQRDAATALMRIAQSETDPRLRDVAIVALGQAGGREQLAALYNRTAAASAEAKRPIIVGLFNAGADEELIRIADRERDPKTRQEVLAQLRLLGTPRAQAYLESVRK